MKLPALKEPWLSLSLPESSAAIAELARELGPRHILRGKRSEAIARRQDRDDVLFLVEGGPQCAVIHLTYSKGEEPDPKWPWTELYGSLEDWCKRRMLPDHKDFTST